MSFYERARASDTDTFSRALQVAENTMYQDDELEEWLLRHATINTIISAEASESKRWKDLLVEHLATAAREYHKYALLVEKRGEVMWFTEVRQCSELKGRWKGEGEVIE